MLLRVYIGKRKYNTIAQTNWKYFLGNEVQFHGAMHRVVAVGREGFQPTVHLKRASP
jgi:hypothetical protein